MGTWTTTPRDWTDDEVVDEDMMNGHVRDFAAAFGAMTSYTPSWTASTTNPTLGNGTLAGWYTQVQKTVLFRMQLTIGSTTSLGSGVYSWSLPVTLTGYMSGATGAVGYATLWDTSTSSRRIRFARLTGSTAFGLADMDDTRVSNTAPWTWATGDEISVHGWYEAA